MSSKALKSLIKKSPWELIRFLTVDQWRAIDNEYLGEDNARRSPLRPLCVGVVLSVALSLVVYQLGYQGQRFSAWIHYLGYLTPMVLVLLFHSRALDWRRLLWLPLAAVLLIALSLTIQELYGERTVFGRIFEHRSHPYYELHSFAWWAGWRFVGYFVFPVVVLFFLPGFRFRDMYVGPKDFRRHLWIYVGLFLLVLPAVLIAAQTKSFKLTYPFYKLANRSSLDFWAWQGLYWLQFLSLEFFFRGFILRVLAPRFGSTAIFVMVVPYCMIHYGKPLPETLGAIIAGVALGTLAMRTKSVWGGALIHIAVALTMDSLAVADCPSAESGLRCPSH